MRTPMPYSTPPNVRAACDSDSDLPHRELGEAPSRFRAPHAVDLVSAPVPRPAVRSPFASQLPQRPPSYSARVQPVNFRREAVACPYSVTQARDRRHHAASSTTLVRRLLLLRGRLCPRHRDDGAELGVGALLLFPRRDRTVFVWRVSTSTKLLPTPIQRSSSVYRWSAYVRLTSCPALLRLRGRRRRCRLANPDCAQPK